MKKQYKSLIGIGCALVLLMASCKKSEYLIDEGLHDATTPLSTYDYLKAHSWQSFDTLIKVIDHFGLKEEVNASKTFFAPTDYSIARFIDMKKKLRDENIPYTMDTLYRQIGADSVRQYLFSQKMTLANASEVPAKIPTLGKTNAAVFKVRETNAQYYQWASTPVFLLYYTKVKGDLDPAGGTINPNDPDRDVTVVCQTSGIETSSGTSLHVLSNTHTFVRF